MGCRSTNSTLRTSKMVAWLPVAAGLMAIVRPKWGTYRSILDEDNLRPDEETVRFANFSISEVTITEPAPSDDESEELCHC